MNQSVATDSRELSAQTCDVLILVPPFPYARNASRLKGLPLAFTMNVLFEPLVGPILALHIC